MEDAEAIWAAKSDDELVEASGELFEYTEEGERIIRAELRRRGLPEPDPPIGTCLRCGRSIAANHPGDRCAQCEEPFPPEILRKDGARALLDGLSAPRAQADADPGADEHAGPRQGSLREQLIGHWTLESLAALNGSDIEYPMGQDVEGVIAYEPTGRMATQIMRYDRPRFASGDMERGTAAELSAALTGYTAYFGTYSVDEGAAAVTHHVKGSLFPNWVGTDQRREIAFDGDHLTLTSQPILFEGKTRVFRAIWRRDK